MRYRVSSCPRTIHGARGNWIFRNRADVVGYGDALFELGGRGPGWPFRHAPDLRYAPGERFLADGYAVTEGVVRSPIGVQPGRPVVVSAPTLTIDTHVYTFVYIH
jgi:hypothetical protein